ncbi:carboxypeptidase regulatory-like domain-containing protein [Wenzhouxiangella marina]|uniref:Uncharacterized protein n=1 Tax=Wenzhouxiangella marina TaxID=1579979 RepID=A0A0K0XTA9_9GAMM|nr:carboxypeptidase regulatory-like domain-containing protein [Wenzhouxiangella marina]AKS40949.1 hypothetical protein WM2015_567 [Wenzhouxiangella marina]MBB6087823.1 hypothetical protein [Wenzhouxiangella marina]
MNRFQIAALGAVLLAAQAEAVITGQVVDATDLQPVADARVRIQTTTGDPVLTDASGQFVITDVPAGSVVVTAVPTYDSSRAINYITGAASAADGDDVFITLQRMPANDLPPPYEPGSSFTCSACHADQHSEWQDSNHSNAGVNEWVLDLYSGTGTPGGSAGYVFRDTHDPGDTGFCATCHAPLEDAQNPGNVFLDEIGLIGAFDGVTCLACHQMAEVNENVSALHHLGNTLYRFPDDGSFTPFWVWGPLDDVSFSTMRASYQPQFKESRFCASCHEYNNPDTGAPGQNTYTEWLASPFAVEGPDFQACQDCHMPAASEPGPISSLGGQPVRPPEQRRSHRFTGATPTTLSDAIELDLQAIQQGEELVVTANVTNAGAGHHFPTGISIRNALLVIEARIDGNPLTQSGGDVVPFYGSATSTDGPDDLAGLPGKGFARVLEGRINGEGPTVRPVLFIDAEGVSSDTRIPSGQTDSSVYRFDLSGITENTNAEVSARLIYRRAWRDTVVTKGWTTTPTGGPIEIEVDNQALSLPIAGIPPLPTFPVPGPGLGALLALALGLLLMGFGLGRRATR